MRATMWVVAACALAGGAAAQTVYKCTAGGKVGYSELPCSDGQVTTLRAAPAAATSAAGGLERDKARLAALEKGRLAAEAREERDSQRAAHAAAALRQKCARLRLKQKWAQEDVAAAGREATQALRTKAKRQAEALAVECPG